MTDRILYQDIAEPPSLEVPSSASWQPEHNQPRSDSWARRWSIAALTALTIAYVGEPIAEAEAITPDKWYQQLSTPTPPKAGLGAAYQQFAVDDSDLLTQPEDVKQASWYADLSVPVLPRPHVAQQQHEATDAEALTRPEDPKLKWYTALAEPVQVAERALQAQWEANPGEPIIPPVAGDIEFFAQLEDPPVTDGPITLQGEFAYAAPSPIDYAWLQPLTEPTIAKFVLDAPWLTFVEDFDAGEAETITLDKWYRPLAEPVLPKPAVAWQQSYVVDPDILTQPEDVRAAAFEQQPTEPAQPEGMLVVGDFAFLSVEVTDIAWHVALAEPLHAKPRLHPAYQPFEATDFEALTQPEAVHVQWHVPLSEPVLPRHQTIEGVFAYVGEPIDATPEATSDSWYRPLSEPVLPRQAVAAQQSETTDPDLLTQPEAVHVQWTQPLDIPANAMPRASEFPALAFVEDFDTPEDVTSDKWHRALAEPVRVVPPRLEGLHVSGQVDIDTGWLVALNEPPKASPAVADQQSLAYAGEPIPDTGDATELLVYPDLEIPPKAAPLRFEYPAIAYQGEPSGFVEPPVPDFGWFHGLNEPVLPRKPVVQFTFFGGHLDWPIPRLWIEQGERVNVWTAQTQVGDIWIEQGEKSNGWV